MQRRWMTWMIASMCALATACDSKSDGGAGASADAPEKEGEAAGVDAQKEGAATPEGDKGDKAHHHHEGGAAPADEEIPEDQSGAGPTENDTFYVTYTPTPNPIPFQELFSLDVEVFASKARENHIEGVSLDQVRAIMPAHDHGMKVEPKIERVGPGKFRVRGMRFHMQGAGEDGRWVLEMVLNDGGRIDQTAFEVQCCRATTTDHADHADHAHEGHEHH